MPLAKGSGKKVIKANIKELVASVPSATRAKGIATLAKKEGISPKAAKVKQAVAISYAKAKPKKK